jgi:energy-coupling factor transporter transmembrane protein EcfT
MDILASTVLAIATSVVLIDDTIALPRTVVYIVTDPISRLLAVVLCVLSSFFVHPTVAFGIALLFATIGADVHLHANAPGKSSELTPGG